MVETNRDILVVAGWDLWSCLYNHWIAGLKFCLLPGSFAVDAGDGKNSRFESGLSGN